MISKEELGERLAAINDLEEQVQRLKRESYVRKLSLLQDCRYFVTDSHNDGLSFSANGVRFYDIDAALECAINKIQAFKEEAK